MSAFEELLSLLDEAGCVLTLDMRRHSRAAREWPDCLPPLFPEQELKVEHWIPDPTAHGRTYEGVTIHRLRRTL